MRQDLKRTDDEWYWIKARKDLIQLMLDTLQDIKSKTDKRMKRITVYGLLSKWCERMSKQDYSGNELEQADKIISTL